MGFRGGPEIIGGLRELLFGHPVYRDRDLDLELVPEKAVERRWKVNERQ